MEVPKRLTERQKQLLREFATIEETEVTPERKGFKEKLKAMFAGEKAAADEKGHNK